MTAHGLRLAWPGTGWRSDLTVALVGLVLLAAWEAAGADLGVTRWFGSAEGFAWRDHMLTRRVLHDGGRILAWSMLALLAWDCWRPIVPGPTRGRRAFGIGVILALAIAVPALKWWSTTSCPWDLAEFDGVASYVPHWVLGISDGGPGRCFPSGHAAAAFAFFGAYFLWRPHRPALARRILGAVIVLGLIFGWAQLARGAHFVSHTAWSAWLCWCGAALAHALPVPLPRHGLRLGRAGRRLQATGGRPAHARLAPRSARPGRRPGPPGRPRR